jgi:hypothetical protein
MAQPSLFPPDRKRSVRITGGWSRTARGLRETGRVEPIDDALLALCHDTAAELAAALRDTDESRFVRARLISEMRSNLIALRDQTRPDVDNLSIEDLFASLGDTADATTE